MSKPQLSDRLQREQEAMKERLVTRRANGEFMCPKHPYTLTSYRMSCDFCAAPMCQDCATDGMRRTHKNKIMWCKDCLKKALVQVGATTGIDEIWVTYKPRNGHQARPLRKFDLGELKLVSEWYDRVETQPFDGSEDHVFYPWIAYDSRERDTDFFFQTPHVGRTYLSPGYSSWKPLVEHDEWASVGISSRRLIEGNARNAAEDCIEAIEREVLYTSPLYNDREFRQAACNGDRAVTPVRMSWEWLDYKMEHKGRNVLMSPTKKVIAPVPILTADLGRWIKKQVREYERGELSHTQIAKLEQLTWWAWNSDLIMQNLGEYKNAA